MKRTTRTNILWLSLLLSMGLASACGSKSTDATKKNGFHKKTEARETSGKEEAKQEETAETEEKAIEDSEIRKSSSDYAAPLHLSIRSFSLAEGEEYWIHSSYVVPELLEDSKQSYPKLQQALESYGQKMSEEMWEIRQDLQSAGERMYSDTQEGFILKNLREARVMRGDSQLLSVQIQVDTYWGTEINNGRENLSFHGLNFDTESGRELKLTDIVTDTQELLHQIKEELPEKYPEDADLWSLEWVDQMIEENQLDFTVDSEGLNLYFNVGTIGNMGDDIPTLRILFREAPKLFQDKYTRVCESYVIPYMENMTDSFDLDGDGQLDQLHFESEPNDQDEGYFTYYLASKSRSYEMGDGYGWKGEVVYTNGSYYIYGTAGLDGGNNLTILDFKTHSTETLWNFDPDYLLDTNYSNEGSEYLHEELQAVFSDPTAFRGETRSELPLGTFFGSRLYSVGERGLPASPEESAVVSDAGFHIIRLKRSLELPLASPDGTEIGKKEMLPEGSLLYPLRFLEDDWVDLQCIDASLVEDRGDEYYSFLTTEEENVRLNEGKSIYRVYKKEMNGLLSESGLEIQDYFDGLNFAG